MCCQLVSDGLGGLSLHWQRRATLFVRRCDLKDNLVNSIYLTQADFIYFSCMEPRQRRLNADEAGKTIRLFDGDLRGPPPRYLLLTDRSRPLLSSSVDLHRRISLYAWRTWRERVHRYSGSARSSFLTQPELLNQTAAEVWGFHTGSAFCGFCIGRRNALVS